MVRTQEVNGYREALAKRLFTALDHDVLTMLGNPRKFGIPSVCRDNGNSTQWRSLQREDGHDVWSGILAPAQKRISPITEAPQP